MVTMKLSLPSGTKTKNSDAQGGGSTAAKQKPKPSAGNNDEEHEKGLPKPVAALLTLVATLLFPALILLPALVEDDLVGFVKGHATYYVTPALMVLLACLYQSSVTSRRRHALGKSKRRGSGYQKPQRIPLSVIIKDSIPITTTLDSIPWRIVYLAAWVVTVIWPWHIAPYPFPTTTPTDWSPLAVSLAPPLIAAGITIGRLYTIQEKRENARGDIYQTVISPGLKYKPLRKTGHPTKNELAVNTIHQAIDVKRWKKLYEIDEFFALAPDSMSVGDLQAWEEVEINMNGKFPREEGWKVERHPRGRGATIRPANYPLSVLWDGETDSDPLTFVVGVNLETGKPYYLTFGEASPHAAVSGATASGKTSLAEIIAAQVLIKSMPWDSSLYGQVVVVDPKGPFARRWLGRPNVICANGQEDSAFPNDDGDYPTGISVMSDAMDWIEEEHKRRAKVLAKYPDVATWIDLPDEVKKRERFAPLFIILDEYLDHTDLEKANGDERIETENNARVNTTRLAGWHARKYRNVGMHTILIGQSVNMTAIGSNLMRNLPIRCITGQMDDSQLRTMFGDVQVPSLPSSRVVVKDGERQVKSIPGRARIQNAGGQPVEKLQIMWFGGKTNSKTLDKWLPRGKKPLNGSFEFPEGTAPRRPEDFDENGELLPSVEQPEAGVMGESAPVGADVEPAVDGEAEVEVQTRSEPPVIARVGADDGEVTPTYPTAASAGSVSSEADDEFIADEGDEEYEDESAYEDSDKEPCEANGCANPSYGTCRNCGKPFCQFHSVHAEDEAGGELCSACRKLTRPAAYGLDEKSQPNLATMRDRYGYITEFASHTTNGDGSGKGVLTVYDANKGKRAEITCTRIPHGEQQWLVRSAAGNQHTKAAAEALFLDMSQGKNPQRAKKKEA